MTTQTLTFKSIAAENAETLNYLLDQDDVTTLTLDEFIEALEDAATEAADSFDHTSQNNAKAFTAAAALLTETLTLSDDHPDLPGLLQRARARLGDADV